jgi:hypothetical protein
MKVILIAILASTYSFAGMVTVYDKEKPKVLGIEIRGQDAKKLFENLNLEDTLATVKVKGAKRDSVFQRAGKNILCFQDPFTKQNDKYVCWMNLSDAGRAAKWDQNNEQRVELRPDQNFSFKSGFKLADASNEIMKVICDTSVAASVVKDSVLHLRLGEGTELRDANKSFASVVCLK